MSDIIAAFNCTAVLFDSLNCNCCCLVDTTFDFNWSHSGRNALEPLANDSISQNCSCCCSVTCNIVCLRSNFTNKLCAHVLIRIFELNFFCNRNTVFCDCWCAEFFVEHNQSATRSESYFYSAGNLLNATKHLFASFFIENQLFSHNTLFSLSAGFLKNPSRHLISYAIKIIKKRRIDKKNFL